MSKNLRIVVAQLNFWIGDISGNAERIIIAANKARDDLQADVVVFPELALCGYPPEDLLLRPDFHQQIDRALQKLQQQITGIDVVLGYPHRTNKKTYNAAIAFRDGQVLINYYKTCLPNYGVFDEKRYFDSGSEVGIFTSKGISIALVICEDLWYPEPVARAKAAGAQLIICINSSPLDIQKPHEREEILRQRIQENSLPMIYAHWAGGQDDLVFDGGSLAMDAAGNLCAHAGYYQEKLFPIDLEMVANQLIIRPTPIPLELTLEARVYQALVLSVHDYVEKNGFPGVLIGLSGGIDSGLTLAIAVDALGNDRVHGVLLPSRYTSELSMNLATIQAESLNVKTSCISIEPTFTAFLQSLAPEFVGLKTDQTEENIQARCRGIILMALSNKTGNMVLTTGNKSEVAVGYATLYGDMVGGFGALKDVSKTLVYRLANYRNTISSVIPHGMIDRPPSAELAPNQKDEDSLPPYTILDSILEMYVEKDLSPEEIIAAGFSAQLVRKVITMVDRNEYKRRQSPPGPRITVRAFSRERRYPITSKYQFQIVKK